MTGTEHIGRKPAAYVAFALRLLGALPGDSFHDKFPGTGIGARSSGTRWRTSTRPQRPSKLLAPPVSAAERGGTNSVARPSSVFCTHLMLDGSNSVSTLMLMSNTTRPKPAAAITVEFGFSESSRIKSGATFSDLPSAERYVDRARLAAPAGLACDKTDVLISVGPESFRFRMDLRNINNGAQSIQRDAIAFLTYEASDTKAELAAAWGLRSAAIIRAQQAEAARLLAVLKAAVTQ